MRDSKNTSRDIVIAGFIFTIIFLGALPVVLLVIEKQDQTSLGTLLSGIGSFLAFVWISIGLQIQMRELRTQNIMRRHEVSNSFTKLMQEVMDLALHDLNVALHTAVPDRATFDLKEAPFIFLKTENLRIRMSEDSLKNDDRLLSLRNIYLENVEYTLSHLGEFDDKSYIRNVFKRTIYYRIYEIIS